MGTDWLLERAESRNVDRVYIYCPICKHHTEGTQDALAQKSLWEAGVEAVAVAEVKAMRTERDQAN